VFYIYTYQNCILYSFTRTVCVVYTDWLSSLVLLSGVRPSLPTLEQLTSLFFTTARIEYVTIGLHKHTRSITLPIDFAKHVWTCLNLFRSRHVTQVLRHRDRTANTMLPSETGCTAWFLFKSCLQSYVSPVPHSPWLLIPFLATEYDELSAVEITVLNH